MAVRQKRRSLSSPKLPELRRSLRNTFGIEQLRPGQAEVIRSVLEHQDTLAIMPTGAGKSLCYQLPALHLEGTTIVVSPLISLMKDQVDKLEERGVEAVQLNSTLTERGESTVLEKIEEESSDFVFTTPERLTDPSFLETLRNTTIDFVVIDEAHCISQWGHDFRPSYLALRTALHELGDPPILALTATATSEVIHDIQRQLGRTDLRVVETGIYRPNLELSVEHLSGDAEKHAEVLQLLEKIEGSGIIYTATVRHVDEVVRFLQEEGFEVEGYHGRLAAKRRKTVQERFMSGELKAIVATNAFGMGIDKPDIRFVLHYDVPGSLEAYYQEAGRAGRDGQPAQCTLLYDSRDRRTQIFLLGGRYPSLSELSQVYHALEELTGADRVTGASEVQLAAAPVARTKCRVAVSLLKEAGAVREQRLGKLSLVRRMSPEELRGLAAEWTRKAESDREKLDRMEGYARSALCRWRVLREYFGDDSDQQRCGVCDNCRRGLAEQAELVPVTAKPADAARGDAAESPRKTSEEAERDFRVGDRVSLPRFGEGKIEALEEDALLVRFPGGRTRKFKPEFARLVRRS